MSGSDLFTPQLPSGKRLPTEGERPCRDCGDAASFFQGFGPAAAAWCWEHALRSMKPGRAG